VEAAEVLTRLGHQSGHHRSQYVEVAAERWLLLAFEQPEHGLLLIDQIAHDRSEGIVGVGVGEMNHIVPELGDLLRADIVDLGERRKPGRTPSCHRYLPF
jgi:hypothetical protein